MISNYLMTALQNLNEILKES